MTDVDPRRRIPRTDRLLALIHEAQARARAGEIAPEEFLLFIYAIGRHDRDGQQSFLQLDVDGRGTLRKGNVEDLALEYFHSAEQGSAGDWLFGPPPEA